MRFFRFITIVFSELVILLGFISISETTESPLKRNLLAQTTLGESKGSENQIIEGDNNFTVSPSTSNDIDSIFYTTPNKCQTSIINNEQKAEAEMKAIEAEIKSLINDEEYKVFIEQDRFFNCIAEKLAYRKIVLSRLKG